MPTVDSPPIFVVSTGRSGSMMLARVLAQLDGVLALHEPKPHLTTEGYLHWKGRLTNEEAKKRIRAKRTSLIEQVASNGISYLESSHYCSHFIPELHEMYNARFVHLYRDGRAFVRSGLARDTWYGDETIGDQIKTWLRRSTIKPIGRHWIDHRLEPPKSLKTRVEKLSWLWVEINEIILQNLQQLPVNQYFSLRLEDVDTQNIKSLCSFLGFDGVKDETINQMLHVASQRPNNSKSRNREKPPWTEENEQQFSRIAIATMKKLGYPTEHRG